MWNMQTLRGDGSRILFLNYEKKIAKFEKLRKQGDSELMDFVYKLTKNLPIFHEKSTKQLNRKSDEISSKYRKEGNELFILTSEFIDAIQMYTKSIAWAVTDSMNLSIAYANRSAILFEFMYYRECLQDIDRAFENNCPDNIKEKLLDRREEAENFKSLQRVYLYHCPLPEIKDKNPLIEAASDSVEIKESKKWGRHVVATKNIKAGDIICIEKPYCQEVDPSSKYLHCHECLELCYNMIPCRSCTEALYCSSSCREQASNTYHKYECTLFQLGLNEHRLFLRIVLKGLPEYKKVKEDLLNKKNDVYRSGRYKEIYELITHKTSRTAYDLYLDTLEPVVFYQYLKDHTEILKDIDVEPKESVLKELLLHQCLTVHCNATPILKLRDGTNVFEKVASVIYSFYSMFNHSCHPNTAFAFYGSNIVLRAVSDIKIGEQVTVYYCLPNNISRMERQNQLRERLYFNCTCIACINDWPTHQHLNFSEKDIPKSLLENVMALYKQKIVNKEAVDKLLTEAFLVASSMKANRGLNRICINTVIRELFMVQGNRHFDFKDIFA